MKTKKSMKTKKLTWVCLFLLSQFITAGGNIPDSIIDSSAKLQQKLSRVPGFIHLNYPQSGQTTQSSGKKPSSGKESGLSLKHTAPLNNYSFDLYHQLKNEEENILLSPLSTYYALLMAYEGSKGETREEFEKILHLQTGSRKTMNSLLSPLNDNQQGYPIFNAIWTDNNLVVKETYKKTLARNYSSGIMQTDFKNKETAVSVINGWITEKTNDKIREVINSSNIKDSTSIVIVNTVYFKGEWLNKFDKQKTKEATFFTSEENQYNVDFMNITEHLPYFETDTYQFISKPYKDSHLSFCIILPKEIFGIHKMEKEMDADFLKGVLDSTRTAQTLVSLPKLKLESSFELSNVLKDMGLNTAFSEHADFSGITTEVPVSLDRIVHKTLIEIDEEKTEAAATTATTYYIRGIPSYQVFTFKADHPFIFFVIDNRSKAILYMGKYSKPTDGVPIENESLASNLEKRENEKFFLVNQPQKILFIIDEKIQTQADFNKINPSDIKSFSIIKNKEKIREYSSGDYEGAIIITLNHSPNN